MTKLPKTGREFPFSYFKHQVVQTGERRWDGTSEPRQNRQEHTGQLQLDGRKRGKTLLEVYATSDAFLSTLVWVTQCGFDLKAARQMVACVLWSLCNRQAQISCTASRVSLAACRHQTLPSDSHYAESSDAYKTLQQPRQKEGAVWKIKKKNLPVLGGSWYQLVEISVLIAFKL